MEVLIRWLQTEATDLRHARLDSDLSASRGRGGELDVISEECPQWCVCISHVCRCLCSHVQCCIIYTIPTAGLPSLAVLFAGSLSR